MFGEARELDGGGRAGAMLLVVGAAFAMVRLQAAGFALRARESRSRTASNLRDVVNLLGAFALWAALVLAGHPPPAALLFAGTMTVLLDVVAHAAPAPARPIATLVVAFTASLVLALAPGVAVRAANHFAKVLFP